MKSFFFKDTIVLPLYLGYISLRDVITAALLEERHMANSQNTRRYLHNSIMLVFISVFTIGCKIVWLPTLGLLESIHVFVGAGDGGVILSLIIREDWRIHKIAKSQMPDNGISQKFTFFSKPHFAENRKF